MKNEDISRRVVVLSRWKLVSLLSLCMSISGVLAVFIMTKFLLSQLEVHLFPIVVSAVFWTLVWMLLTGIVVIISMGMVDAVRRFIRSISVENRKKENKYDYNR